MAPWSEIATLLILSISSVGAPSLFRFVFQRSGRLVNRMLWTCRILPLVLHLLRTPLDRSIANFEEKWFSRYCLERALNPGI